MNKISGFSFCTKIIFSAFFVLSILKSAEVQAERNKTLDDIYVVIGYNNATVNIVFKSIEKQTSFSFAYDENDVNLSKEVKLIKGRQRLKNVLTLISQQTGLRFTENQNVILVRPDSFLKKSVVSGVKSSPVTGVVTDNSGVPLQGVTVSLKGSKVAVQTDLQGKFSIDAPENGILVLTIIGYKTTQIAINGQA